ncbi:apolipoprotein N-acyltransferase [Nocardioides guangzhouensis]|uniref:Apolipoprotein N-acyltransferase n=1 Tax=Nocardioides guangzhouensis TaxID=2497878 RepID=A0A4Q4ZIB9_9ACTN|nr:apolipoprotein N-acyltransferase [Nocardioides guangzhouensis]RYP87104.1 apolipoprotein N-acyltransferase [Nocardioides guangzhouensis]
MPRIALSILCGVALALSFEPYALSPLLPVSVAGFFWCVHGRSLKQGALLGFVFGVVFWHVHIFWMRVVGYDAWLALSLFMTLWFVLLGFSLAAVSRLRWWPAWFAVVWVAIEVVRGAYPMSGFTWGRLAFATVDTPYAGWLPWIGTNGVSLLVALSASGLAWLVLRFLPGLGRPRLTETTADAAAGSPVPDGAVEDAAGKPAGSTAGRAHVGTVAVLAVIVLAAVVPAFVSWHGEDAGTARVAIVQGNVPGDGDNLLAYHQEVTRSHLDLTRELAADVAAGRAERPDFVVWPENATAVDPFRDEELRADIRHTVEDIGVPLLFGGIVDAPDPDEVLNQGIVYDPGTGAGDRYTKRHPVPFGEYIPYREKLGINRNFSQLSQVPRDMLSGTRTSPLRIDGTTVADAICFDVAYDDAIGDQVRGGAEMLTVQTSNAFFIHTGQIEQQFAISRLRALETGRPVVVASVNGRSGFINPDGSVAAAIEPRTRAVLQDVVPLVRGVPPAMWVGPWLGRAAVVVAAGAVLWALLPYRRRRIEPAAAGAGAGRVLERESGA